MNRLKKANKKIEDGVVGTYNKIEKSVVGVYQRIEDRFVDTFLKEKEETEEKEVGNEK